MASSPSPAFQNAAFAAAGIEAAYEARSVDLADLEAVVGELRAAGLAGLNVTIPFKVAIREFLDEEHVSARECGAVNTVVVSDGRWTGHNTDGSGFLDVLAARDFEPAGARVAILGAGGAARAVAAALLGAGAHVGLVARRPESAQAVATALASLGALRVAGSDAPAVLAGADLLVSAVPPAAAVAFLEGVRPDARLALDLSYAPGGRTPFVRWAAGAGIAAADGAALLLYQGARAFELWTGQPMPLPAARRALVAALGLQEIL